MQETPDCCKECIRWEQFGKECWAYWELKKDCTLHTVKHDQILQ